MTTALHRRELAERVLALLDLTDLRPGVGADAIERLCARALGAAGPIPAVCVAPAFVAQCARDLAGSAIAVATVVNFPAGGTDTIALGRELHSVIEHGADELDVVFPHQAFLAGDLATVTAVLRTVQEVVAERRCVKIILETGVLADPHHIREAARVAIAEGADFLKTSTGTTAVSATPEAVDVVLEVIREARRPVGIKVSGGLRHLEDAAGYLAQADAALGPRWARPATFRFGASGLFDTLCAVIEDHPCTRPDHRS